ncbi:MAG: OmpA family protein [Polyangiaceae bacterium]|nr:OmpA family protein [Polyangiaceae bacterium]MCW5789132.1 OmpA family protein [Polyangiaceae bacterium]
MIHTRRLLSTLLAAFALLALSTEASAQQSTFYLDRIQISGAPDDGFAVWRPYMAPKTRFYGAATLGYTLNPLRGTTLTDDARVQRDIETPLRHQLIAYLQAGAELSSRLGVNISLPVTVYQGGGADPQRLGVGGGLERDPTVLNDLRLDARVRAYESDSGFLRLGGGGAVWVPVGAADSFASDDAITGMLYGSVELDFDAFYVAGNIGPHFRPERGIGNTNGVLALASELRYGVGAYLPLRDNAILLGGELWGTTGLVKAGGESTFFASRNTDLEWLAHLRLNLDDDRRWYFKGGGGTRLATGYGAPDVRVLVQVGAYTTIEDTDPGQVARRYRDAPDVEMSDRDTDGDGYPDDVDACPNEKEDGKPPDPTDGCPAPGDRDNDGIPDDVDQCPDDPEDKDGIQDADGCPEDDADKDGIPDTKDACPLEPGLENKLAEKNGCPGFTKLVEESGEIELLQPIQFETARSTIKAVSYPILDEVVALMRSRSELRIAVHGHTDSRGSQALNTKLSKDRAKACMDYLIRKGISADRLTSEGFGPDKPVADNDTEAGRAKNRRVEFRIID